MKTIYNIYESIFEGILAGVDSTLAAGDKRAAENELRNDIEKKSDGKWTLSKNGKYVILTEKPSIMGAPNFGSHSINNVFKSIMDNIKEWCGNKQLKIQPISTLYFVQNTIPTDFIKYFDSEYVNSLEINTQGNLFDLSELKLTNIGVLKIATHFSKYNIPTNIAPIIPPKNRLSCVLLDTFINNINDWNCDVLIVSNNLMGKKGKDDGQGKLVRMIFDEFTVYPDNIQVLIDNNPKVTNFFIRTNYNGKFKYYPVKIKNGKFVKLATALGAKAMESKGIIPQKYAYNDYKSYVEWVEENSPNK